MRCCRFSLFRCLYALLSRCPTLYNKLQCCYNRLWLAACALQKLTGGG
ncbi:MAG: hypothetical protein MR487_02525 [Lachnospiraceae bacterium]|nr:hypothetical protein [Lachnospiraceae bacterium]